MANTRQAALEEKAERLPDYEGPRARRLRWRFAALECSRYGCYSVVRIGPNLVAHLHLPDLRQHGGRTWANEQIAAMHRKVCDLLVDAICWLNR
ncbi:MAG TPA: hypothetical protein VED46_18305 [Alphaproteobacteria bacterium]|nr:hypothetical protein [Alphaproteobacteria bacterium]